MAETDSPPGGVINLADVPLEPHGHEGGFEARFGPIGTRLLGCRLYSVRRRPTVRCLAA